MNLGSMVGKVSSGSHATAGFKEDKKNKAIPGFVIMIVHYNCAYTSLALSNPVSFKRNESWFSHIFVLCG